MGQFASGVLCALDQSAQSVSFEETALAVTGSPSTQGKAALSRLVHPEFLQSFPSK